MRFPGAEEISEESQTVAREAGSILRRSGFRPEKLPSGSIPVVLIIRDVGSFLLVKQLAEVAKNLEESGHDGAARQLEEAARTPISGYYLVFVAEFRGDDCLRLLLVAASRRAGPRDENEKLN